MDELELFKEEVDYAIRNGRLDLHLLTELLPLDSAGQLRERVRYLHDLLTDAFEEAFDLTMVDDDPAPEDGSEAAALQGAQKLDETDRYELGERLGRGGVGEVLLARDRRLDRTVAVKLMLTEAQASPTARSRFLYEGQVTARLGHPGIIPVHDMGSTLDGRWFYAMRKASGKTMAEVLKADRDRGSPEPSQPLLRALIQVCLTMAYAHDHGVIHRDLKPSNILLGRYGEVYVADWGLAKRVADQVDTELVRPRLGDQTLPGTMLGTLQYIPPEQVRGDDVLTPAADVWGLGIILFEILTLQLPFAGRKGAELMVRILSSVVPNPREATPERNIDPMLAQVVLSATVQEAEQRTMTAREMAERLTALLDR